MAFNPSPKVAAARRVADEFDQDMVVVLMVSVRDGTMQFASYGKTRKLCGEARHVGDAAYEAARRYFEGPTDD